MNVDQRGKGKEVAIAAIVMNQKAGDYMVMKNAVDHVRGQRIGRNIHQRIKIEVIGIGNAVIHDVMNWIIGMNPSEIAVPRDEVKKTCGRVTGRYVSHHIICLTSSDLVRTEA